MRALGILLLAAGVTAGAIAHLRAKEGTVSKTITPPVARVEPKELTTHGHTRIDEYYWLRDDERARGDVLDYLAAENEWTQQRLAHRAEEQDTLLEEMKARIKKDDDSVPYLSNGYWYYTRFRKGQEYAVHCRKKGTLEATEEVMLDGNARAEGHEYYAATGLSVSSDNRVLAFSEDTVGRRLYTLRFKDLASGAVLDDEITGTAGAVSWALDGRTVFYVRRDEGTLRAFQVWRHELGTPGDDDVLVYEEKDDTFLLTVWRTRSRRFLVISSYHSLTTEHRILDANDPTGTFTVFLPREREHEHEIQHGGDRWFVRTNWKAKNFRLMEVEPGKTQDRASWREVVGHRADVYLADVAAFQDHVVVRERVAGLPGLRVLPRGEGEPWSLSFDEPVYNAWIGTNAEYETGVLRYGYTSLTTPLSVYDYDLASRKATLKKQQEVLGGFRREDYVSERLMAKARDGTSVPISLVYRKNLDRTKPQSLYQYGYGSYGASMDAYFSSDRLSLLDRGFIFAVAHIRGGQEMGRAWYDDGKLLKKKNTFTDFIDCSEHLVAKGYTTPAQLVASGGSAGGLLVGAVVNMRPDLYRAVIAHVPFVDVVTTMLDESIPLTTFEYDEWGNPNDETLYRYMLSYSPYDNVEAKNYPHIFVFSGLHDSQVQYWEPTKWVARLRARKTDSNRLLLHTNMDAGHGLSSGRFKRLAERAMEYAFLLDVLEPTR